MKWRTTIWILLVVILSNFIISAGQKNTFGSYKPTPLRFDIPKGWPKPNDAFFKNNPLTEEGFQLGRNLFYDGRLSADGETSCANCHQQFASFASYDHDLSHGVNNSFTTRNAPVLINLAWMKNLHWDGGINHIEVQALSPLTAPNEMGESLENVLKKLNADSTYKRMFYKAFGTEKISSALMLKALAQFELMLVSANSKYDRVMGKKDTFSRVEKAGYEIFKAKCNSCHTEPLFTDNAFHNNGLSLILKKDIGLQGISGLREDSLKFKTPTLRNNLRSLPYMHDGRIFALYQVIDHYTTLDTSKTGLDPVLKKPMALSVKEKGQLLYFLYTLNDTSFYKNKRFAAPNAFTIKH